MKIGFYYSLFGGIAALLFCAGIIFFVLLLRPVSSEGEQVFFEVQKGEGFREIVGRLAAEGLVRSEKGFTAYAVIAGAARNLRPGTYRFSPAIGAREIVHDLRTGEGRDIAVTIPPGSTVYDIDRLLSAARVVPEGEFAAFALARGLEGYLPPDTYRFYFDSDAEAAYLRFKDNFDRNIAPLLGSDEARAREILIAASVLEKEVPDLEDRKVVMGLLLERLRIGMPLQVDASVCYAKRLALKGEPCYPVTRLDTQMASAYNTYLHKGWPPGPIANPGISAVQAALSPIESPYLYYLSDPRTRKTIFSKTLEEHEKNRRAYLTS